MSTPSEQAGAGAGGRSLAEWVSFGVAAAILAAVAGLVVLLWVRSPSTPPKITVTQSGAVRTVGDAFYVPFRVMNSGGLTADSVLVVAELLRDGEAIESSEQEFTFLSGGEVEEGAFVFAHDPRSGELRLRAGAYRLP